MKRAPQLVVLGGGSAAFAAALEAEARGAQVTILNAGLPLGGTCVNVGCVPSKFLLRAAEELHGARHPRFPGIESRARLADWSALRRAKTALVEELRAARYRDVAAARPGIRVLALRGRLAGPRAVRAGDRELGADRILIATGARPVLPAIPGLAEAQPLTYEDLYELEELPRSLIVLGGRFLALEAAQTFARLGVEVTLLQRSPRLMPQEAPELGEALRDFLAGEGLEIHCGLEIRRVARDGGGIVVEAKTRAGLRRFRAERVLAALGRRPATEDLGLETAGVERGPGGEIRVDEFLATSAPGIYAAGDAIGGPGFVYTAAYEGSLAARNMFASPGERVPRDERVLPWVLFTDPELAGVGLDLRAARAAGFDAEETTLPMAAVPRCLAARDTRGFLKLVRDRGSDRLLGARVLAPGGGELLMELSLAIRQGLRTAELARALHPYLTLSEAVKLAALSFEKNVGELSCCAS